MKVFKTKPFCRFTRKEKISDTSLLKAVFEIISNNYDAKLGANLFKQRVAREGKGSSGGYRVIICLKIEDKAFFLYGFPKSVKDNISQSELKLLKEQTKYMLALSPQIINELLLNGSLEEISTGESQ